MSLPVRLLHRSTMVLSAVRTTVLGAVLLTTGCLIGEPGPAYYSDDYPPDAYIATTDPYYFDGHATYWYGGRWYYRDGRSWRHYDHEPPALYQRRVQGPPVRRHYEARPAGPVGRGSWHTNNRRH